MRREHFKDSVLQWRNKKKFDKFLKDFKKKTIEREIENYSESIIDLFQKKQNRGKTQE